jgi:hypothetical protein
MHFFTKSGNSDDSAFSFFVQARNRMKLSKALDRVFLSCIRTNKYNIIIGFFSKQASEMKK